MVSTIGANPMTGGATSPLLARSLEGIAPIFVMVGLFAMTELMTRAAFPRSGSSRQRRPRAPAAPFHDAQDRRAQASAGGRFDEGLMPAPAARSRPSSPATSQALVEGAREIRSPGRRKVSRRQDRNDAIASTAFEPASSSASPANSAAVSVEWSFSFTALSPDHALFEEETPEVVIGLPMLQFVRGRHWTDPRRNTESTPLLSFVKSAKPYLSGFILGTIYMSGVYTVHMSLFDLGIVMTAGLLASSSRYFGFPSCPRARRRSRRPRQSIIGGLSRCRAVNSRSSSDPLSIVSSCSQFLIVNPSLFDEWRVAAKARKKKAPRNDHADDLPVRPRISTPTTCRKDAETVHLLMVDVAGLYVAAATTTTSRPRARSSRIRGKVHRHRPSPAPSSHHAGPCRRRAPRRGC